MPLEYYFMLAGLVLLLIEFVVPGFGIFGVSGMVCLTVGGFYFFHPLVSTQYSPMLWPGWFVTSSLR